MIKKKKINFLRVSLKHKKNKIKIKKYINIKNINFTKNIFLWKEKNIICLTNLKNINLINHFLKNEK